MINKNRLEEMLDEAESVKLTDAQREQILSMIDKAGDDGITGREIQSFIATKFGVHPNQLLATTTDLLTSLERSGTISSGTRKVYPKGS